jgi:hypothetical protein
MPYAVISTATSGDNTIVAAATNGRKIRVQEYLLVPSSAVTVTWKSGSTAISGAMDLAAKAPLEAGVSGQTSTGLDGVLQTAGGEALVLTLGGAVQVSGHIKYEVLS